MRRTKVAGELFLFESENKYNLDFNFNLISDLYPFIGIISEYLSFFLSALEINSYHFYQHFLISFWNWVGLFKADFLILWVQFTNYSYRYAKYSQNFDTLCYNKDFVYPWVSCRWWPWSRANCFVILFQQQFCWCNKNNQTLT